MCGIFGFISSGITHPGEFRRFANLLAEESAQRGQDATGFAGFANGEFLTDKRPIASKYFTHISPTWRKAITSEKIALIGHTRHGTSGNKMNNKNNHPFHGPRFSVLHNGIVQAHEEIADAAKFKLQTHCDSELFIHFLNQPKPIEENVADIFAVLDDVASMALAIIDRETGNVYVTRNNGNPAAFARIKRWNVLAFASTPTILSWSYNHLLRSDKTIEKLDAQTEVLYTITPDGEMTSTKLDKKIAAARKELQGTSLGRLLRDVRKLLIQAQARHWLSRL